MREPWRLLRTLLYAAVTVACYYYLWRAEFHERLLWLAASLVFGDRAFAAWEGK